MLNPDNTQNIELKKLDVMADLKHTSRLKTGISLQHN